LKAINLVSDHILIISNKNINIKSKQQSGDHITPLAGGAQKLVGIQVKHSEQTLELVRADGGRFAAA
jgi:hypothetical protein